MSAPLQLTEIVLLVICPNCNYSGCRMCCGTGRVPHDPYRRGAGEQGDDFQDVPPGQAGRTSTVSASARGGSVRPARTTTAPEDAEPSLRVALEQLVARARVVCPRCVFGAGECDDCNGTGWVFA